MVSHCSPKKGPVSLAETGKPADTASGHSPWTRGRNSWGEEVIPVTPNSGARKPVASPGSSSAWDEEPEEGRCLVCRCGL